MEKDVNRLRLAKEALESGSYDRETIEYIFPELKESENEKIREELLNAFQESEDSIHIVLTPHRRESFIAWLKKQGEQKPDDANNRFIRMRETKPKDISEFLDRLTTVEQEFLWEHIAKIRELDKEEQKPADKFEPKFHEGDWVVSPNGVYWHIDKISNNRYEVTSNTGESSNWNLDTNIYHKFTIQDAKDGDVLYSPCLSLLWIFKSIDTVYCGCNLNYNDGAFCGEGYIERPTDAILATKEQRDTLEKAMADAGWKFDFEKKELKKIEQKTAWSDGDDYNLQCMIAKVTSDIQKGNVGRNNELIEWLKSLKDRYTWKPSEEQIEILDMVLSNESMDDNVANILRKLREQLKKLREE